MKEIENHFTHFFLSKDNIAESQNNHKKRKKIRFTEKLARKKVPERKRTEWHFEKGKKSDVFFFFHRWSK